MSLSTIRQLKQTTATACDGRTSAALEVAFEDPLHLEFFFSAGGQRDCNLAMGIGGSTPGAAGTTSLQTVVETMSGGFRRMLLKQ
jgi:hypothetical protein